MADLLPSDPDGPDPGLGGAIFLGWLKKRAGMRKVSHCERKCKENGFTAKEFVQRVGEDHVQLGRTRGGEKIIKLQENKRSLHIARIPEKTKLDFIALAEADFCGDYGMTLKWLMDDLINPDTKLIMEKVAELDSRMAALEGGALQEKVPEKKTRRMLDGTEKRRLNE